MSTRTSPDNHIDKVLMQFQHNNVVVVVVVVVLRQFQDEHRQELAKAGPTYLFLLCSVGGTAPPLEVEGALEQL